MKIKNKCSETHAFSHFDFEEIRTMEESGKTFKLKLTGGER